MKQAWFFIRCIINFGYPRNAITKAINAIITFWISFITVATSIDSSPSNAPAATTAPVESIVPPIQAPPIILSIPHSLIKAGRPTSKMTVDNKEIEIVNVRYSFLALVAAATAIAARQVTPASPAYHLPLSPVATDRRGSAGIYPLPFAGGGLPA